MCIISIIIPVYNVEEYLVTCIESCMMQSYENIEIILIDDGSKDQSGKICDKYSTIDKRIVVHHIKNSGPSKARNYGLECANGEYVLFVDSDDWIEKETIETCYNEAINSKSDVILFNMCDFEEKEQREYRFLKGEKRQFVGNEIEYIENILLTTRGENEDSTIGLTGPVCKLFKRTSLLRCQFPEDINSGEDACFVGQVLKNTQKLTYINRVFYHRRVLKNSLSHSYNLEHVNNRVKYVNWMINYYEKVKPFDIMNMFCYKNYYLVAMIIIKSDNIGICQKRNILKKFLKDIKYPYDFSKIKIECSNRNMKILQIQLKQKKIVFAYILVKIAELKQNVLRKSSEE